MLQRLFPLAAFTVILSPAASHAAPYASAVTEAADSVSFILNESADSVKVVFNEGATTQDLGPLAAGTHSFPKGTATSYRIEVEKNAGPGWKSGVLQQLTADTNDLMKFANGRGVAVNKKADTGALFGRIYVSLGDNGIAAPVTTPATTPRGTSEGIYVLNPDFTATNLGTGALKGDLTFSTSTESPYRITVGDKGDLFIADWSDDKGTVYKTDGNVGNGKNVFSGPTGADDPPLAEDALHGSIAAVITAGSEAAGDLKLWVIDEDLQNDKTASGLSEINSIWEWDSAGQPLPIASPPFKLNSSGIAYIAQAADLARGPDGTFYKLQRRASGNDSGIFAVNASGEALSSVPVPEDPDEPVITTPGSRPAWQAFSGLTGAVDIFVEARACDVSDDGWLAVLRSDNGVHLVKVDAGVIDFSSHIILYTKPSTIIGRDVSFDAAGNLYVLSSGQAVLRVYSTGGHTKATTSSTGTFAITNVTPPVPPAPIQIMPMVSNIAVNGAELRLTVTSQIGLAVTHQVQRSPDLGGEALSAWETLINADVPFTLVGDPPTYTVRIPNGILPESKYFYRIKRL